MPEFRVICINDKARPDGIPTSKWVKEGECYTVTSVAKLLIQGGKLGFKLAELNIDDCFPYQYFSAERFGIPVGTPEQWAQFELDRLLDEAKKEAQRIPVTA